MIIKNKKQIIRAIVAIVVIVCTFASLSSGYYVDENGTLAIYRGIYMGQHMFVDTWEALQTGGLLTMPLFALYYDLMAPFLAECGIGLVLFLRIVYLLTRLFVAGYLYFTLRQSEYKKAAFPAALIYYMFVVGWFNFSYKSYCDMAVVLICCFVIRFFTNKRYYYFILIGLMVCVSVVAYPSMLIFAIILGAGILFALYRTNLDKKALIMYVVTCLICGAAVIIYLQLTTGIGRVFSQLKFLGDQDYDYSIFVRILRMLGMYVAFAVIAYAPIVVFYFYKKYRYTKKSIEDLVLAAYWVVFMLGICLARIDGISNSRYVYGLLILFFWFPYLVYEKKEENYTAIGSYGVDKNSENIMLWIVFGISASAQLVWALSTNQDIAIPAHMSICGVLAVVIYVYNYRRIMRLLVDAIIVAGAFFAIIWVPESNGGFAHVFEPRLIVEQGALTGICVQEDYYQLDKACFELVTRYVTEDDNLMVTFGSNSTAYINSPGKIAGHTVYDRTHKNTKVLTFWQEHPEHQAKFVLINQADKKYEDFSKGETGKYIFAEYPFVIDKIGDVVLFGGEDLAPVSEF